MKIISLRNRSLSPLADLFIDSMRALAKIAVMLAVGPSYARITIRDGGL
jgi:hypothetical protein